MIVTGFGRPVLCRGKMPRPVGWRHTYKIGTEHFTNQNLTDCCEMLVICVCGVRQNLYMHSLYCNPDLDDLIFDCLLASMAAVPGCPCVFPVCG